MWTDAILAYLHYAAIFTLVWFLAKQWTLLRTATLDIRRLGFADIGYGASAAAVLFTGLGRLFFGAKPLGFYVQNPVFHTKVGLFLLLGLISILPTVRILAWRKAVAADAAFQPGAAAQRVVRRAVMIQLHGIALIPLLAALMARAIGYQP